MIDRSALSIVLVVFILAAAIAAVGQPPERIVIQSRPPVLIVPTSAPTATPDQAVQQELAQLRARVAELERQDNSGKSSYQTEQPAQAEVPTFKSDNVTLEPTAAPTPWVADPQIRHNENGSTESVITVPTNAPRLCTGFHDWRDYDAMYASSPVCGQP